MNIFQNIFTDYKSQLLNSENENKILIDELQKYKTDLLSIQNEYVKLNDELKKYKTDLQSSKDKEEYRECENDMLNIELKKYQSQLKKSKSLLQISQDENKKLIDELKKYKTELQNSFNENKIITNKLNDSKTELYDSKIILNKTQCKIDKVFNEYDYSDIKIGMNLPIHCYLNNSDPASIYELIEKIKKRNSSEDLSGKKNVINKFFNFQKNEKIFYCVLRHTQMVNQPIPRYICITTYGRVLHHGESFCGRIHNKLYEFNFWLSKNLVNHLSEIITTTINNIDVSKEDEFINTLLKYHKDQLIIINKIY